jgi:hypothetical protein
MLTTSEAHLLHPKREDVDVSYVLHCLPQLQYTCLVMPCCCCCRCCGWTALL